MLHIILASGKRCNVESTSTTAIGDTFHRVYNPETKRECYLHDSNKRLQSDAVTIDRSIRYPIIPRGTALEFWHNRPQWRPVHNDGYND